MVEVGPDESILHKRRINLHKIGEYSSHHFKSTMTLRLRIHRNRKHNRNRRSHLLCGRHRASHRNDDIDLEPDELGRDIGVTFAMFFRPAIFDRDCPPLAVQPSSRSRCTKAALPAAERAPRAATPLPRRRAWPRIFVVRCGLPSDPPVGGHSCHGGMIPRFHRPVCGSGR